MKIRLIVDGTSHAAMLDDTEPARDFAALLPLDLTLEDYAPWGNLALFYRSFAYSTGLVRLGRLDAGGDALRGPGPLSARIERIER